VLWLLPIAALHSDRPITTMPVEEFLAYYLATIATSTLMWWASRHWFRPSAVRLSWRAVVLEVARWPVVALAVINVLLRVKRPYMITPKGAKAGAVPGGGRIYGLYFGILALGLSAVFVFPVAIQHGQAQGYLGLVLVNCAFVVAFLITAVGLELVALRRRLWSWGAALRARAGVLVTLAGLLVASGAAVAVAWAPLTEALG
jgi:cellulose synthase (UDP-forming)